MIGSTLHRFGNLGTDVTVYQAQKFIGPTARTASSGVAFGLGILLVFLHPAEASDAMELTLADFSLFGVSMHQTSDEALLVLKGKSQPTIDTTRCLSEEVFDIQENTRVVDYDGSGACPLRATSTVEVGPGEKKQYYVQFFERYQTEPGVMEVVRLEYKHGWDTQLISPTIDPYEILKNRFGEHDRLVSEYGGPEDFVWDFAFNGNSVTVTLTPSENYFFGRRGDGYSIKIAYTDGVISNWMYEKSDFAQKSVIKKSASDPDF